MPRRRELCGSRNTATGKPYMLIAWLAGNNQLNAHNVRDAVAHMQHSDAEVRKRRNVNRPIEPPPRRRLPHPAGLAARHRRVPASTAGLPVAPSVRPRAPAAMARGRFTNPRLPLHLRLSLADAAEMRALKMFVAGPSAVVAGGYCRPPPDCRTPKDASGWGGLLGGHQVVVTEPFGDHPDGHAAHLSLGAAGPNVVTAGELVDVAPDMGS